MPKSLDAVNTWMFYTAPEKTPPVNPNLINLQNTLAAADPAQYIASELKDTLDPEAKKAVDKFFKKAIDNKGTIDAWSVLVYICQLEGGCTGPDFPPTRSTQPPSPWKP